MTRQDVKKAVQATVQQLTQIKAVNLYRNRLQVQFPCVTIAIPKSKETRISAAAPHGKKRIDFTVQLEIFDWDNSADGSYALTFDDLLDQIDGQLRLDPTLGGVVWASTVEYIHTTVAPPQKANGQTVALLAIKQFDVTMIVTG